MQSSPQNSKTHDEIRIWLNEHGFTIHHIDDLTPHHHAVHNSAMARESQDAKRSMITPWRDGEGTLWLPPSVQREIS